MYLVAGSCASRHELLTHAMHHNLLRNIKIGHFVKKKFRICIIIQACCFGILRAQRIWPARPLNSALGKGKIILHLLLCDTHRHKGRIIGATIKPHESPRLPDHVLADLLSGTFPVPQKRIAYASFSEFLTAEAYRVAQAIGVYENQVAGLQL